MKTLKLLNQSIVVAFLLTIVSVYGCSTAPVSGKGYKSYENDRIRVFSGEKGRNTFSVSVQDDTGTNAEHAGKRAKNMACRIARERGFTHMAVKVFEMGTAPTTVTTYPQPEYVWNSNGNVVDIGTKSTTYNTINRGTARIDVILLEEKLVSGYLSLDMYQLIDARNCKLMN